MKPKAPVITGKLPCQADLPLPPLPWQREWFLMYVWRYGILGYTMKRTTVWLTDAQVKKLTQTSKRTGLKVAELIRRFIDEGLRKQK